MMIIVCILLLASILSVSLTKQQETKLVIQPRQLGFNNYISKLNSFNVVNTTFDFSHNLQVITDISKEICKFYLKPLDTGETNELKCMVPAIQTGRSLFVSQLSNLTREIDGMYGDGEIFSYLYAYEGLPEENSKTLCFLGIPHARLLTVLQFTKIEKILIFLPSSDKGDNDKQEQDNKKEESERSSSSEDRNLPNSDASSNYDNEISDFLTNVWPQLSEKVIKQMKVMFSLSSLWSKHFHAMFHHSCDIIHIGSEIDIPSSKLKEGIDRIASSSLSRVIWTSNPWVVSSSSLGDNDYSSLFNWQLTSTWSLNSQVKEVIDSTGFITRGYEYCDNCLPAMSVVRIADLTSRSSSSSSSSSSLSPMRLTKKAQCPSSASSPFYIVITYTNRVFAETAFGLKRALFLSGFLLVKILHDLNLEMVMKYQAIADSCSAMLLQIAIAPHDLTMFLSQNYIVYHLEQVSSDFTFGRYFPRYKYILNNALAIFTFSSYHLTFLQKKITSTKDNLFIIPLYSSISANPKDTPFLSSSLTAMSITGSPSAASSSASSAISDDDYFDVAFLGSCTSRRANILTYLYETLKKINPLLNLFFNCGSWSTLKFDDEKDFYFSHSKIILNIHSFESSTSVLESHRLQYLLSLGKCVISERGLDEELALQYDDSIIFVGNNYEEFIYRINDILSNTKKRKEYERKAFEKFQEINSNLFPLQEAMKSIEKQILKKP
jgi:hypothetical protein